MKKSIISIIVLVLIIFASVKIYRIVNKDKIVAGYLAQAKETLMYDELANKILKIDKNNFEANSYFAFTNQYRVLSDYKDELNSTDKHDKKSVKFYKNRKSKRVTSSTKYFKRLIKNKDLADETRSLILSYVGFDNLLIDKKSEDYFQQAVELDSTNTIAWYCLAISNTTNSHFEYYVGKFIHFLPSDIKAGRNNLSAMENLCYTNIIELSLRSLGYELLSMKNIELATDVLSNWHKLYKSKDNYPLFLFAAELSYDKENWKSAATLFGIYAKYLEEDFNFDYELTKSEKRRLAEINYYAGISNYNQAGFGYIKSYTFLKKASEMGYKDADEPYEYLLDCGYTDQTVEDYKLFKKIDIEGM